MSVQPIWYVSRSPVPYQDALSWMEEQAMQLRMQGEREVIWLLEHPSVYTIGTSGGENAEGDLISPPGNTPIVRCGRGGRITYHGPGVCMVYAILDLATRQLYPRDYVMQLMMWIQSALGLIGLEAVTRSDRIGLWVVNHDSHGSREDKITAVGVRIRHGVAFHGAAIYHNPDLSYFKPILPCGIRPITEGLRTGVTSIEEQGIDIAPSRLNAALRLAFRCIF